MPDIDGGFGFSILVGHGFTPALALEVSFLASFHDAEFLGARGDVRYRAFNIDVKYNFLTAQTTHPFLLVGLNIPTLVVKDGSASVQGQVGDAEFTGSGLNLGVGVDHYVTPHFLIGARATYRIVDYDEAEGVVGEGEVPGGLNGKRVRPNV